MVYYKLETKVNDQRGMINDVSHTLSIVIYNLTNVFLLQS